MFRMFRICSLNPYFSYVLLRRRMELKLGMVDLDLGSLALL